MPLNTHVLAYSLFYFHINSIIVYICLLQLFRFRYLLTPFHFSLSLAAHRETLSVHLSVYAYNLFLSLSRQHTSMRPFALCHTNVTHTLSISTKWIAQKHKKKKNELWNVRDFISRSIIARRAYTFIDTEHTESSRTHTVRNVLLLSYTHSFDLSSTQRQDNSQTERVWVRQRETETHTLTATHNHNHFIRYELMCTLCVFSTLFKHVLFTHNIQSIFSPSFLRYSFCSAVFG